MDLSHHSTEINDYIVHCFATGEYKATLDTLATKEQIEQNIATLLETYPEIPTLR
jgi:flagellar basal body-associated protein FliL